MEININPEQFLNTVISAAMGNGLVPSGGGNFKNNRADNEIIVIAAAPKSGSTFLMHTLIQLTGYSHFRLCSAYSTNEHDLYLPALCIADYVGCVSQMHMKGTFHNAGLLNMFGIKPIILVRRIYDIVISLLYDLREKEKLEEFGNGYKGYSFIWQDEAIRSLDDERLLDLIIDLIVPWYVNFYVSWYRLCERGSVNAIWITYEDMMADKHNTVNSILNFVGAKNISNKSEEIFAKRYPTFRDGSVGRSDEMLSNDRKDRIKKLFSYYHDIDFGKYGI